MSTEAMPVCELCGSLMRSTSGFWECPHAADPSHPQKRLPLIGRDRVIVSKIATLAARLQGTHSPLREGPYGYEFDVHTEDYCGTVRVTVELLPR